ncbi:MAG: hypothetical protein AAF639_42305 [Chloroflexota bacterium]
MIKKAFILFLLCLMSTLLLACGGGGESEPEIETAEGADINATLASAEWEVKLVDAPFKTKAVGSGAEVTGRSGEFGDIGTHEAEGMWLILPVELSNKADEMLMLGGKLFKVVDGVGNEYAMAPRPIHASAIWHGDRWGEKENQLPANPIDVGLTHPGPLVFEVPSDATGLQLIMDGVDGSIRLGF